MRSLWKLLVVLSAVAITSYAAPTPAGADSPHLGPDRIAANVSGKVNVGAGGPCTNHGPGGGTLPGGETTTAAAYSTFSEVAIAGLFQATTTAAFLGAVTVTTVSACPHDHVPEDGDFAGALASDGALVGGPTFDNVFQGPQTLGTCVDGDLNGGTFTTLGAIAIAVVNVDFAIYDDLGGECPAVHAGQTLLGTSAAHNYLAVVPVAPVQAIAEGNTTASMACHAVLTINCRDHVAGATIVGPIG